MGSKENWELTHSQVICSIAFLYAECKTPMSSGNEIDAKHGQIPHALVQGCSLKGVARPIPFVNYMSQHVFDMTWELFTIFLMSLEALTPMQS